MLDVKYLAPKLSRPDSGSRSLPVKRWEVLTGGGAGGEGLLQGLVGRLRSPKGRKSY